MYSYANANANATAADGGGRRDQRAAAGSGLSTRSRVLVAGGLAVFVILAATGYTLSARVRNGAAAASSAVTLAPGPRIAVISTAAGSRGRLATVSTGDPSGPRRVSQMSCTRAYAAGGTGICLRRDGLLSTYQMVVLNSTLHVQRSIPLVGLPNRARVSPDGRMVAWTVFVSGDSYDGGELSTRAGILDTRTGTLAGSLEDFAITLDGRPDKTDDANFWGVTFAADDNTFYATMETDGRRYLVRGDFGAATLRTIRENVECPSLSPDGTRIAFKQAVGDDPARGWRLSVLDLASGTVTRLAETRSVDDQVAWLSNTSVGYGIPRGTSDSDVWTVPADGTGTPSILVPDAASPAALD